MSASAILEELAREFVHLQDLWSESLLLSNKERQSVVASECHRLSGLIQDVHRCLMDLRCAGLPPLPSYGEVIVAKASSSGHRSRRHCSRVPIELPPTNLRHFICGSRPMGHGWPWPSFVSFFIFVFWFYSSCYIFSFWCNHGCFNENALLSYLFFIVFLFIPPPSLDSGAFLLPRSSGLSTLHTFFRSGFFPMVGFSVQLFHVIDLLILCSVSEWFEASMYHLVPSGCKALGPLWHQVCP